jgi:hypothetical protein
MSNPRKRPGALSAEEWQEIAKDDKRLVEAAKAFRHQFQNATLVEASRAVLHINRKFKENRGRK